MLLLSILLLLLLLLLQLQQLLLLVPARCHIRKNGFILARCIEIWRQRTRFLCTVPYPGWSGTFWLQIHDPGQVRGRAAAAATPQIQQPNCTSKAAAANLHQHSCTSDAAPTQLHQDGCTSAVASYCHTSTTAPAQRHPCNSTSLLRPWSCARAAAPRQLRHHSHSIKVAPPQQARLLWHPCWWNVLWQ